MEEPSGADAQLQVDNQMMVYSMIDGPLMPQSPLTKLYLQIKGNLPKNIFMSSKIAQNCSQSDVCLRKIKLKAGLFS